MNKVAYTAAVAALMNSAAAIKQQSNIAPDVYGPNGENYQHNTASYDLSRIGIDITEQGTGPKCKPGDWVTVHWVGTLKDGREITNSHQEPGGRPKTFSLGAREVFHCWDLAITQLHQGDKAHLDCPSYYAYGGAFTWAPIGGEPIPLHSDVDFDIEIVECNRVPDFTEYKEQPVTTTMQPGRCMYIHSEAAEEEGTPLVITCENEDRINQPGFNYFPAVPCYLDEWVKENKHQQYHYVEETGVVKDFAHEWELCIQFGRLALCNWSAFVPGHAHPTFSSEHTKWWYDGVTMTLQNKQSWGSQFPYTEHTVKWAEVLIDQHTNQDASPLDNINAHFRLEYCWKNF